MESNEYTSGFLSHWVHHRKIAAKTYAAYKESLKQFCVFVTEELEREFVEVTSHDILSFKARLEEEGRAVATVRQRMTAVRMLFEWMETYEHIENSPFPKLVTMRGRSAPEIVLPSIDCVFRIRQQSGMFPLERVLAFEFLVSSGLRREELIQVRFCDVDLDNVPIDIETGKPSTYCGGSVVLEYGENNIKGKRTRRTYISKLAAKLLQAYMDKLETDTNSPAPILPYGYSTVYDWIVRMVKGELRSENEKKIKRSRVENIDVKSLGIKNKGFERLISRRQKKARTEEPDEDKRKASQNQEDKRYASFSPHTLRHMFSCCMLHRNYHGERSNEVRLIKMLGHTDLNVTLSYLSELDWIGGDENWKRLMLGKRTDWRWTR